jgi:hypothetical protein
MVDFQFNLYAVINHRGIIPTYVHAVWKLHIPPWVQIFQWLLSKNRLLTRDNLAKRREVLDQTCSFCSEKETIKHLFFQCIVAKRIWCTTSELFNLDGDFDFDGDALDCK